MVARERGKLLRLDLTHAPWRAARERLALPLAVAILCLMVAFVVSLPHGPWNLVWTCLALASAASAVFGTASGRRILASAASFSVLGLMSLPMLVELVGHNAVWSGVISRFPARSGVGVDVFVLWLPVAVLLPICATAVGRDRGAWRRRVAWIICAAVAISAISGLAPPLLPDMQALNWPEWLGGAFIWVPLFLVATTVVTALIKKDPVAETAASLLVAASSFPVVWLLPALVPFSIVPYSWYSSSFWFLLYAPQVLGLCFIMWVLLRHRRSRAAA